MADLHWYKILEIMESSLQFHIDTSLKLSNMEMILSFKVGFSWVQV